MLPTVVSPEHKGPGPCSLLGLRDRDPQFCVRAAADASRSTSISRVAMVAKVSVCIELVIPLGDHRVVDRFRVRSSVTRWLRSVAGAPM